DAAQRDSGAPQIRGRSRHRLRYGPGSATHHCAALVLRCARDTNAPISRRQSCRREHFMARSLAIDYEVEYNNPARVPEHPQIFERWIREGAAYRDEASKEGRAEIGLKYGPSPRQTIDLFRPNGGGTGPLVLFIHGGYWRSLEPSSFSQVARGMNAHGVT